MTSFGSRRQIGVVEVSIEEYNRLVAQVLRIKDDVLNVLHLDVEEDQATQGTDHKRQGPLVVHTTHVDQWQQV